MPSSLALELSAANQEIEYEKASEWPKDRSPVVEVAAPVVEERQTPPPPAKKKFNRADYMFTTKTDEVLVKTPG